MIDKINSLFKQVLVLDPMSMEQSIHFSAREFDGLADVLALKTIFNPDDTFHYSPLKFWQVDSKVLIVAVEKFDPTMLQTDSYDEWISIFHFNEDKLQGFLSLVESDYRLLVESLPAASWTKR